MREGKAKMSSGLLNPGLQEFDIFWEKNHDLESHETKQRGRDAAVASEASAHLGMTSFSSGHLSFDLPTQ